MTMRFKLFAAAVGCAVLFGCGDSSRVPPVPASAPAVTELQKIDRLIGSGPAIEQGQVAVVHYTGWLYDDTASDKKGRQFDSSRERGVPFRFKIGDNKVIQGWEQGVVGMQVGGQRRLIIPPHLGYGDRGGGPIPPNATLLFDIELLAIE
jgi:FKBP-type peptidyl-prolyl cis-trans isomerase FkpA